MPPIKCLLLRTFVERWSIMASFSTSPSKAAIIISTFKGMYFKLAYISYFKLFSSHMKL